MLNQVEWPQRVEGTNQGEREGASTAGGCVKSDLWSHNKQPKNFKRLRENLSIPVVQSKKTVERAYKEREGERERAYLPMRTEKKQRQTHSSPRWLESASMKQNAENKFRERELVERNEERAGERETSNRERSAAAATAE